MTLDCSICQKTKPSSEFKLNTPRVVPVHDAARICNDCIKSFEKQLQADCELDRELNRELNTKPKKL